MASVKFRGDAPPVAQITHITPAGTIESGDLFKATIGTKTLSYASTATTIASVCSGFTTAWNALASTDYPEFAEITAADNSTSIRLTCDTPGKSFTVNVTTGL